jgi:hypothetical protein
MSSISKQVRGMFVSKESFQMAPEVSGYLFATESWPGAKLRQSFGDGCFRRAVLHCCRDRQARTLEFLGWGKVYFSLW